MAVSILLALVLAPVSVSSLLPEMTDLERLARRPNPWHLNAQSSSFDRAAYLNDPFANGDAGKFLRQEGQEQVMADLKGPGVVTRIWSANPAGKIRFYFDGEAKPTIEADMAALLTGKIEPFTDPYAYIAAQGTNLYFPFPYAKSLKITAEGPVGGLYYQVNHRGYPSGTQVQTYSPADLERNRTLIAQQASKLLNPPTPTARPDRTVTLNPGQKSVLNIRRPVASAVKLFQVKVPFPLVNTFREMDWDDAYQPHNVLRSMILTMRFNGQETVRAPLGDFFATAPGVNPNRTLPFEVREDGTMICRLVMPFNRDLQIQVENIGKVEVPYEITVETMPYAWDDRTYLLHAQWEAERSNTRPMRDMRFLDVKGEGVFIGSNYHIANPVPQWWGEGDEKFYIDGESRPSTFGTGTEDYYGYAWCSPELFHKPYHSQPRCDGPANMGHSQVQRWHIVDPVPFQKSFRFDMELWHWAVTDVTVARTLYWYARPGTTPPVAVDRKLLLPPEIEKPKPIPGAIEGEKLAARATGGELSVQGGFWQTSGGEQRWWVEPKVGDQLVFDVPVPEGGEYELIGNFCHAGDYGRHRLSISGQPLGDHDFYSTELQWKQINLGKVRLTQGTASFTVECLTPNPKARPARMFGLDYLILRKL